MLRLYLCLPTADERGGCPLELREKELRGSSGEIPLLGKEKSKKTAARCRILPSSLERRVGDRRGVTLARDRAEAKKKGEN